MSNEQHKRLKEALDSKIETMGVLLRKFTSKVSLVPVSDAHDYVATVNIFLLSACQQVDEYIELHKPKMN